MPFLLAHLPREILVMITSLLPDADAISRLNATGNRYLMGRLSNGGVTHVTLMEDEPLGRVFNFIPTLRLVSISICHDALPETSLKALIRALPKTLLRFSAICKSHLTFWSLDDSPQKTPLMPLGGLLSHFAPQSDALWRVKDSFPNLQVLKIDAHGGGSEPDFFAIVSILCGLPDTLIDLSLCFLDNPGFDYYALLPPNLESLSFGHSPTVVVPTQKHGHLLLHLTSLHLRISEMSSYNPSWEDALGSWRQPHLKDLWLPPSLTSLYLTCDPDQTSLLRGFPNSLVTLSLASDPRDIEEYDLFLALSYIPSSVTSLHFAGFDVQAKNSSHGEQNGNTSELAKLPSLKQFRFCGDLSPSARQRLLKSMPSCIEEFEWRPRYSLDAHLTLEMLMHFDAPRLHTLIAPLAYECFSHGDGSPILASKLPQLHRLHIVNLSATTEKDFNFASIPPTVTTFISDKGLSSKYLHQLPSSVTRLRLPSLEVLADSEYGAFVSTGFTHPKEVLCLNYPMNGDLYRFHGDSTTPLYSGVLSWTGNIDFPRTVTELTIGFSNVEKDSFTPECLPLLKKLTLNGLHPGYDILVPTGAFKTLEELVCPTLSYCDACPPNLTRLVTLFVVPANFEPLPDSITHLECRGIPEHSHLSRLRSLMVKGPGQFPAASFLHLATSITSITLAGAYIETWSRDDLESFFDHFCSLEHLLLKVAISLDALEHFTETRPPHVSIEADVIGGTLQTVDVIAATAGIGLGQIPCYPGDKTESWLKRMALAAQPAFMTVSPKLIIRQVYADESVLPLLPYLSSSSMTHCIAHAEDLARMDVAWPSITSLKFDFLGCIYQSENAIFNLPATLTKLILDEDFIITTPLIASLPLSLTHLEIPNATVVDVIGSWPHRLARLAVWFPIMHLEQNLEGLPASLRYLELTDELLDPSFFPAIPEQIVSLNANLLPGSYMAMLDFAKSRGNLAWTTSESDHLTMIEELSPQMDFATLLDDMALKLRSSTCGILMDVDGDGDDAHGPQETPQIETLNSSFDAVNAAQSDDECDLPAPKQRSKRVRGPMTGRNDILS